jgi:hypothetical protein
MSNTNPTTITCNSEVCSYLEQVEKNLHIIKTAHSPSNQCDTVTSHFIDNIALFVSSEVAALNNVMNPEEFVKLNKASIAFSNKVRGLKKPITCEGCADLKYIVKSNTYNTRTMLQPAPTKVLSNIPTDIPDKEDDVIYLNTSKVFVSNHSIDALLKPTSTIKSIGVYDVNQQLRTNDLSNYS